MRIIDKFKNSFNSLNPSNYTMVDKREYETVYGNYESMLKTYDDMYLDSNARPSLPIPYLDTPAGSKIPTWILSPLRMYDMADQIGDLRIVFEAIQREMFKNGPKLRPKFKYRCNKCLKMYKNKPTRSFIPIGDDIDPTGEHGEENLECDECGNTDKEKGFTKPDPQHRVKLQALLDNPVNNNGQSIIDVGRAYERDLDIIDQGYCLVTRRYYIRPIEGGKDPVTGATHEVDNEKTEVDEIIRLHPIQMAMISNSEGRLGYDNNNVPAWICPNYEHRTKRLERPFCDKCGCKAFTAVAESSNIPFGLPVADPKKMMYAKDELIWTAGKFQPDLLYGNSPILSIWRKCLSLFHQDEYIWKYFDKDRPPKSLLIFGSRNYETVSSFMERQKQGAKGDPYMPRPITVNTDDASKAAQFIDLTPNFRELELTELRKELRQVILTMYGVTPIYAGEQQGSGLGNQGLQVTITNRSIKWYQKIFNEKYFAQITEKIYGVHDWEIVLIDAEEIDMLRDEQIRGQKIDNASKMYQMGFDVYTDGNDEILTSQFPNPERQAMMSGMGSNVKQGNLDKTKKTVPLQEEKTNFSGEPLLNRPSDKGGESQGSTSAGFSYSNKSFDAEKVGKLIQQGIMNNWTITNISKKVAKAIQVNETEALEIVKFILETSVSNELYKRLS